MKKFISLFILCFTLSFSANAQEANKDEMQTLIENDIKSLSEYIKIDNEVAKELHYVFLQKQKEKAEINGEEAEIMLERKITSKLESVLGKENFSKLSKNKALLNKLTH